MVIACSAYQAVERNLSTGFDAWCTGTPVTNDHPLGPEKERSLVEGGP